MRTAPRAVVAIACLALLGSACGNHRSSSDGAVAAGHDIASASAAAPVEVTRQPTPAGTASASTSQPHAAATPPSSEQPSGSARGAATSAAGVTRASIVIGGVMSRSGSFGPDLFTPFSYGASAFFDDLDAHGGINGRQVTFTTCDDGGEANGNTTCVRKLVDDRHVFALVANDCLVCNGLSYASAKGVPSVGGQAVDGRDYALTHTWRYDGNPYPQDGHVGYHGKLYTPTQQYLYFKRKLSTAKAAVVYYDDTPDAKNEGLATLHGLAAVGIAATGYPVSGVVPVYDREVADMKARGITGIWTTLSASDSTRLCSTIDAHSLAIDALLSPASLSGDAAVKQLPSVCRSHLYDVQDPGAATYDDTSNPGVAAFRASMQRHFPDRMSKLSQWFLDGWTSAMWFTDAASACGSALTRSCLEKQLDRPGGYAARGLWWPRGNAKVDFATTRSSYRCVQVTQWDDAAGRFVVRGPFRSTCATAPYVSYPAPGSG